MPTVFLKFLGCYVAARIVLYILYQWTRPLVFTLALAGVLRIHFYMARAGSEVIHVPWTIRAV